MSATEQDATAIEPSRVMVLTDDEQRLIVAVLCTYRDEAAVRLTKRIETGDAYVSEVDELARITLTKRRLEEQVRRINRRIAALEPIIVEQWAEDATTGVKHAGTGANLRRDDKVWVRYDADLEGLGKNEADLIKADLKAQAGAVMEQIGLGHFVRPDWNANTVSAHFRGLIRDETEAQRDLPEEKRTPVDPQSFLPVQLRGLLRIDTTPHIQVRAS